MSDAILTPEQIAAIRADDPVGGPGRTDFGDPSTHKTQKIIVCDSHEALREQLREAIKWRDEACQQNDIWEGVVDERIADIRSLRDQLREAYEEWGQPDGVVIRPAGRVAEERRQMGLIEYENRRLRDENKMLRKACEDIGYNPEKRDYDNYN